MSTTLKAALTFYSARLSGLYLETNLQRGTQKILFELQFAVTDVLKTNLLPFSKKSMPEETLPDLVKDDI